MIPSGAAATERSVHVQFTDLPMAARCWASACGDPVASRVAEELARVSSGVGWPAGGAILAAAVEGTRLAEEDRRVRDPAGAESRGLVVAVRAGRGTSALWRDDSHEIMVREVRAPLRATEWAVDVEAVDLEVRRSTPARSLLGLAWAWRGSDEGESALLRAAELCGLSRTWLDDQAAWACGGAPPIALNSTVVWDPERATLPTDSAWRSTRGRVLWAAHGSLRVQVAWETSRTSWIGLDELTPLAASR